MNKLTYLLSMKIFLEKENDYIAVFSYIVLQCLNTNYNHIDEVKQCIKEKFNIEIPTSFIKTCIKRLSKLGFTTYNDKKTKLTSSGEALLDKIEQEMATANRSVNALIEKIKITIPKNIQATNSEILETIVKLIEENTKGIAGGFKNIHIEDSEEHKVSPLLKSIILFFINAEEKDNESFETLKSIGQGVIINSLIKKDSLEKIDQSFSPLKIYMDTNFIFALLDLSDVEKTKAAKELINLIKSFDKIQMCVFGFTIDEIKTFLANSIKNYRCNFYGKNVTGARAILNNMPRMDIQILSSRLESILSEKGISVIHAYDKNIYTQKEIDELNGVKMELFDPIKNPTQKSLEHDINACNWIANLRGKKVYSIEDAGFIFLTLDNKLWKFSARRHDASKPEVITMEALTALIWLKKPNLNSTLPIHNIIAGCKEKIMIREDVWNVLIKTLREVTNTMNLTAKEISILSTNAVLDNVEGLNSLSPEESRKYIIAGQEELRAEYIKKDSEIKQLKERNVGLAGEKKEKEDSLDKLKIDIGEKQKTIDMKDQSLDTAANVIYWLSVFIVFIIVLWFSPTKDVIKNISSINLGIITMYNPKEPIAFIVLVGLYFYLFWKFRKFFIKKILKYILRYDN